MRTEKELEAVREKIASVLLLDDHGPRCHCAQCIYVFAVLADLYSQASAIAKSLSRQWKKGLKSPGQARMV